MYNFNLYTRQVVQPGWLQELKEEGRPVGLCYRDGGWGCYIGHHSHDSSHSQSSQVPGCD